MDSCVRVPTRPYSSVTRPTRPSVVDFTRELYECRTSPTSMDAYGSPSWFELEEADQATQGTDALLNCIEVSCLSIYINSL